MNANIDFREHDHLNHRANPTRTGFDYFTTSESESTRKWLEEEKRERLDAELFAEADKRMRGEK